MISFIFNLSKWGWRTKWLPPDRICYLCCHAHFNDLFTHILHQSIVSTVQNNIVGSRYAAQGKYWLEKLTRWYGFAAWRRMEDKKNGKVQREQAHWNPKSVSSFNNFLKIRYQATWKSFLVINTIFDARWTNMIL